MSAEKSPLERVAEHLAARGVEFLVIGGQAAALMGSPLVTYDIDLCYRRSPENIERLAAALRELGVTLRGAPKDLPFRADARAIANGLNFTFETPLGELDLLGEVEPIGRYEALLEHCESYPTPGLVLRTISLEDLIRVKQHLNRPKDRAALFQLLAIKRIREEEGKR